MFRVRPPTPEEAARDEVERTDYFKRLKLIPPEIDWQWRDVGHAQLRLAWGHALQLPSRLKEPTTRRAGRARAKIGRDPAFRSEIDRLFKLLDSTTAYRVPTDDPLDALWQHDWELNESVRRSEIVFSEGRKFASEHPVSYLSPDAVLDALVEELNRRLPDPKVRLQQVIGQIDDELAPFYVNPLRDLDATAPVGPGRILLDVTELSFDDLVAIAPHLAKIQERLGYKKQRGRHYEGNGGQMEFVHQMRTSITGRGKIRTWKQVRDAFHDRFGDDISEATLKARYASWKRFEGVDIAKESPRE